MALQRVAHACRHWRAQLQTRVHRDRANRQRGAYTAAFAVMLVFLLGFVGLAMDSGRMFIAKTELQNAADACSLAAASTLSTLVNSDQIALASATGVAVATSNQYKLQGKAIPSGNVTVSFSYSQDGTYSEASSFTPNASNTTAPYAKCVVTDPEINPILTKVWNIFTPGSVGTSSAKAMAKASLIPGGSACGFPIAICDDGTGTLQPPSGGNAVWLEAVRTTGTGAKGWYNWIDFKNEKGQTLCDSKSNPTSTPCVRSYLTGDGMCQSAYATQVSASSGFKSAAQELFNNRFGIYKDAAASSYDPDVEKPDFSGVIFNPANLLNKDVYPAYRRYLSNGTAGVQIVTSTSATYSTSNDLCTRNARGQVSNACSGSFTSGVIDATYSKTGTNDRKKYAMNRRMVLVPIVSCTTAGALTTDPAPIKDWACALLTTPFVKTGNSNAWSSSYADTPYLEYRGLAKSPTAGCINLTGSPSGSSISLIPGLVQ